MAAAIGDRIAANLGVDVQVVIRTSGQLADIVAGNPLPAEPANPPRFFVAFLTAAADRAAAAEIEARPPGNDRVWASGAEVFLWCPGGFSVLGLTSMIEEKLGVTTMTRNWNTVTKLARYLAPSEPCSLMPR